jgi:hypothetical protein
MKKIFLNIFLKIYIYDRLYVLMLKKSKIKIINIKTKIEIFFFNFEKVKIHKF